MPRVKSGTAQTDAERMRALRRRKAERGEPEERVVLTTEAAARVDRAVAAGQAPSRTAYVNALILRASH